MDRIDDFPTLCAFLGKAKTDRIRNHQLDKSAIGGARTRWVQNPHQFFLQGLSNVTSNPDVDDILSGICNLNEDGSVPLSANRLFILLAYNKRISTDVISASMAIDARQARRYMAAARLAIFQITRAEVADTWEIEDLMGNPWVPDELPRYVRTRPVPVRTSPTLAEIRQAHY